ncbi:alpha/beta hydrolase [Demequina lignilytica]|uniref:Alpha/beta hydrolase n=1 Tax=Demequina lignilytica TaxID=3051663 RepID=A0AB35MK14_9MICO|nr:alpha/beta hydrolase [Demequina sp. SYSU T0a273]MDN4484131.1 alpha/beta hydrolase [Demequina sp. SYSU T0a273]
MPRPLTAAVAAALTALLLAACVPERAQITPSDDSVPTSIPSTTASSGLDVYDQTVDWSACGVLECATIQVPVDWTDPTGPTTDLAINRSAATGPAGRIGSLLINPGGPGGSGLDLTEYFVSSAGEDLLAAYDVIGFDPRGVGQSSPLQCGDADVIDTYYLTDLVLDTEGAIEAARQATVDFAAGCRELSGPLIENVDTTSAARDMDVIRALLGDDELYYLGFSYGTQLGATYAALYPENVGRMVLDGAVDFLLDGEQVAIEQAEGFERSLGNFAEWCLASAEDCPLTGTVDQAKAQVKEIALHGRDSGYQNSDGDRVNGNELVYGIVVTLYDEGSWPYLSAALQEVADRGTADIFFQLANFYLDKDSSSGEYLSNSMWSFTAIGCLDGPVSEPTTVDSLADFTAQISQASPTFGWWFAGSLGCDGWPWEAKEPVTSLEATADAAPILVVGTTNDPATPYSWAESLTERLGDATLLTYDGEGHTAYGRSNQCIIDAVDGYLVDGEMPVSGTTC